MPSVTTVGVKPSARSPFAMNDAIRSSSSTTRIRFMSLILPDRDAQPERRSGSRLRLVEPDRAAVGLGDRRHDRQAESEALVSAGGGEALEDRLAHVLRHA